MVFRFVLPDHRVPGTCMSPPRAVGCEIVVVPDAPGSPKAELERWSTLCPFGG